MDETLKKTTGGLALALALGGCGSEPMQAEPVTDPVKLEASIKESLDRLRTLEILDAGQLVVRLPAEATACYGLVCREWEGRYQDERARQAARLTGFVDIAVATAPAANLAPRQTSEAAEAVRALSALQIVEIRGLVQRQAASSPYCYNLPCRSDVEAVDRENSRRVSVAFTIAERARKNGL